MNKTHIRAYTKALQESAMNRQTALEIELAVGFAVLYECESARRLARETLVTIYTNAGWSCDKPGALDWRAVNRRITASIALYDFVGMDTVQQLADGHKAAELVEAFRPMIRDLKVKSVNEVLLACDKVRAPRKVTPVEGRRVDVGHLHLVIPASATPAELMALATKLMQMAMEAQPLETEHTEHDEQVEA